MPGSTKSLKIPGDQHQIGEIHNIDLQKQTMSGSTFKSRCEREPENLVRALSSGTPFSAKMGVLLICQLFYGALFLAISRQDYIMFSQNPQIKC